MFIARQEFAITLIEMQIDQAMRDEEKRVMRVEKQTLLDERLEIIRQQHHLQASSAAVERKDLFDATQRVSFEKHEDGHEWGNVGPLLPALFRVESEMLFVRNCVVKFT
jgi:hypothetical protein